MVIGDSDFASNRPSASGNRDLFMNTMNWLAQQENLISIRPKDPDDRRITLTDCQQKGVMLFALIGCRLPSSGSASTGGGGDADEELPIAAHSGRLVRRTARVPVTSSTRRSPSSRPRRSKVFAGVEPDEIDELKVSTVAGGARETAEGRRRLEADGAAAAKADESEVNGMKSNWRRSRRSGSSTKRQDLGQYGLKDAAGRGQYKSLGEKPSGNCCSVRRRRPAATCTR